MPDTLTSFIQFVSVSKHGSLRKREKNNQDVRKSVKIVHHNFFVCVFGKMTKKSHDVVVPL